MPTNEQRRAVLIELDKVNTELFEKPRSRMDIADMLSPFYGKDLRQIEAITMRDPLTTAQRKLLWAVAIHMEKILTEEHLTVLKDAVRDIVRYAQELHNPLLVLLSLREQPVQEMDKPA